MSEHVNGTGVKDTDCFLCPRCRSRNFVMIGNGDHDFERTAIDDISGKALTTIYRTIECLNCSYRGEYVTWRETSRGRDIPISQLPLTQPPARSNAALILDAQRIVLASEPSMGVAVQRAQSFEQAEYIVWCVGSVLRRVRTAQREVIMGDRESYRYRHVWDGIPWNEFWFQSGWVEGTSTT